jgi:four helix bundle protein
MSGNVDERNNRNKEDSIIAKKSYAFALEIIKTYKLLNEQREYILSKQVLRSGTSIGANVNESIAAVSKKDFVNKLGIALKEARETSYWLNLLKDSNYIEESIFIILIKDCDELIKILNSIILTINQKYLNSSNS